MTSIVLRRRVMPKYRVMALCGVAALLLVFSGVFLVGYVAVPLARIMGSLCPACGTLAVILLWHALFHPDLLWTIDRDDVTVRRGNAFGRRTRWWPMTEVARVRVRKITGDDIADTYYVELKLASGKRLKLPPYKRQGRSDEIAEQIEAWRKSD
jgi:uncharacterized membrane protein